MTTKPDDPRTIDERIDHTATELACLGLPDGEVKTRFMAVLDNYKAMEGEVYQARGCVIFTRNLLEQAEAQIHRGANPGGQQAGYTRTMPHSMAHAIKRDAAVALDGSQGTYTTQYYNEMQEKINRLTSERDGYQKDAERLHREGDAWRREHRLNTNTPDPGGGQQPP